MYAKYVCTYVCMSNHAAALVYVADEWMEDSMIVVCLSHCQLDVCDEPVQAS